MGLGPRGFTLIELMVVVILIGILTVMAIPTMAEARYNAMTLDDATQIAELYREARTRAVGRGAAMMVEMTSSGQVTSGDRGTFLLYEAQVAAGASPQNGTAPLLPGSPLSSCSGPATNWTTIMSSSNAPSTLIDQVNLNGGDTAAQIWTTLSDPSGVAPVAGGLCYTPLGRAYYQASPAPIFTQGVNLLHGALQIAVQRAELGQAIGLTRTVIIPDSGSTRIVSR